MTGSVKTIVKRKTKERLASDNLCKKLAERYPQQFAEWVFGIEITKVKILKTELSREPIRADSAILLSEAGASKELLHTEFQTTIKSSIPVPLRMLDYYVGYKRQHPERRIRQVLIVLKDIDELIPDRYEDERTRHIFDVIKMWEEDAQKILQYKELAPFATLCRTDSSEQLLNQVAKSIGKVESKDERRELINMSQAFAGLKYDMRMVYEILKETNMLEESVVVQDWLKRGERKGLRQGKVDLVLCQLKKRFGRISVSIRKQIETLSSKQVEDLGVALLDFKNKDEFTTWLSQHKSSH
jgi:predicted transposase YdaD